MSRYEGMNTLEEIVFDLKKRVDELETKFCFKSYKYKSPYGHKNKSPYGHVELLFYGNFGLHTETIGILNPKLRGLTYYGERYISYRIFFNNKKRLNNLSILELTNLQEWLDLLNIGLKKNED